MRHLPAILRRGLCVLLLLTSGAATAFARAYEMIVVPANAAMGFNAYRIDTATGAVVRMLGGNWTSTSDPTPLSQGDYHMYYGFSADGKTFWVYKIDDQTGRTWYLNGSSWATVAEPK
jgi:hypothetical protein